MYSYRVSHKLKFLLFYACLSLIFTIKHRCKAHSRPCSHSLHLSPSLYLSLFFPHIRLQSVDGRAVRGLRASMKSVIEFWFKVLWYQTQDTIATIYYALGSPHAYGQARDGAGRGQGWPLQFRFSLVVSVPIVVVAAIILCGAFENLSKTKSINLLCVCVWFLPLRPACLRLTYKWKSQAKATNKNSCKHNGKVLANWFVADVLLLLPTTIVRRCQTCGRFTASYLVFYFNYLD